MHLKNHDILNDFLYDKFSSSMLTLFPTKVEWVSDSCLTPIQQFFSYLSWREQVNFQWDDAEVGFALHQHAELEFYRTSSLKQQSAGRQLYLCANTEVLKWTYVHWTSCIFLFFFLQTWCLNSVVKNCHWCYFLHDNSSDVFGKVYGFFF